MSGNPWGTAVLPPDELWPRLPVVNDFGPANMLVCAAIYAEAGIPVFPCRPGRKDPNTRNGFKDATVDPDRVEAWWRRHPGDNIGIPTGLVFDVLDIDVKDGAPGQQSYEQLRRAGLTRGAFASVTTPTGGRHLLYAPSGDGNHSLPRHGIDTRCHGGYVVAPPSQVGGRGYVWSWVRLDKAGPPMSWQAISDELLGSPTPRPRQPRAATSRSMRGLVEHMGRQHEDSHNRNRFLFYAANRALDDGLDPWELREAAISVGLKPGKVDATIRSAERTSAR